MVYGILKFINFAHGDILMAGGAYIGLFVFDGLRGGDAPPLGTWTLIAFFLAMLISMGGFSAVLGMSIERIAYKPLRGATRLAPPLLSAIGVSFILSNSAAWVFGTHSRKFNYPFDNTPVHIGDVVITPHQILILSVSLIMMIILKLFVDKTRMGGKAMRATSLDQGTAMLMGINVNKVISMTFAIGSALAAVGGILIALDFKVYATMGTMTGGLKAFVAAVVGGIGNISGGAMFGGILLGGILETFGVAIFGIPTGLKDTIAFGVLILILLIKPEACSARSKRRKCNMLNFFFC